ncbi:MAG: restriction endonuclease subunit S [Candidatus Thiodiazotropha endolucinida]
MSVIATDYAINDWTTTPLKAEVTLKNGKAYNAKNWETEGYPIIRIQNLKDPTASFNYFQGDPETQVPIRKGDLLFSWSGSKGTSFGPHIWHGELGVLNQHIFKVILNPGSQLDQDFLFFALKFLTAQIEEKAYGLAALVHVRKGDLEATSIPLPPLPEQKKIAHILSTVQRAIEAQERIIQTTTELKKALMHKFFTEGLRNEPQKQTEIGPVPESWEVVELGDVINLFAGYAFKSKEGVSESNTQLLRMGNLYQNTLDLNRSPICYPDSFADAYRRFVLKEGDLVMSLTGTSGKEDFGFTVRIPKTEKTLMLNQRVTRIDITDDRLKKDFAHHFLLSRKFLDFLYPTAKGMKQANLSTNAMKKLKVVLPDKEEQSEIATCFKSLDQKIVVASRKVAALQDLFRTLLHELLTAKIRVH